MKYAYSIDGEEYHGRYDTAEQAAIAGFKADTYTYTDTVEVCEVIPAMAHTYVNGHQILEDVVNNACDELGECAEDWLDKMPPEKINELNKLIGDWLEAYEPITFFGIGVIRTFDRCDVYGEES